MRIFNTVICALLLLQACYSLPFGSKPKRTEEEAKKNRETSIDDEKVAVRGAAAAVSKELVTNPIVDYFFQTQDSEISNTLKGEVSELVKSESVKDFLTSTRRSLHRHPELMYQESFTSETIQTILTELDIPYTTGWAKNLHQDFAPGPGGYGVVGHIGTGGEPCIILRADMDALPILEKTKNIETFRSMSNGKMHACGHDGHVTMLLGAAAILKKFENSIKGTIRLMFQPAEEGGAGGKRMVEEGVVEMSPKAQHAFGLHVWPT